MIKRRDMLVNTLAHRSNQALIAIICTVVMILFGIGGGNTVFAAQRSAHNITRSSATALPGYDVDTFVKGTQSYFNPDSVEVAGKYVYIGYQNITAKDGTDNKSSTVVQYTLQGKFVQQFSVKGHNDGLRFDPYTNLLWATSNEDGNPRIVTINTNTRKITPYTFPPTPHGGGYDDLAFVNGKAFIAASNPTLNSAGVNVFPAVDEITLQNGNAMLKPVLYGNATALDTTTNQQVTLNLTDPDSMTIDPHGDLVLVSQADAELIFLHNPGTSQQTVTRVPVGTQVDDTIWIPTSTGHLLVVDSKNNITYRVGLSPDGFTPGSVYTVAPSDSGVAGFAGTVDLTTGTITPVMIGFGSPTGLGFIPI
jgi:hypothetical protein